MQLYAVPVTDITGHVLFTDADGSPLVTWFPFFQLQRNATLLLTDLTAYGNPADALQVGPQQRCHPLRAGPS